MGEWVLHPHTHFLSQTCRKALFVIHRELHQIDWGRASVISSHIYKYVLHNFRELSYLHLFPNFLLPPPPQTQHFP